MLNQPRTGANPVRPREIHDVERDLGDNAEGVMEAKEIVMDDDGVEEARAPNVLRDPGAPTEKEIAEHSVTHLPYRAWCPACVKGKARDRQHQHQDQQADKGIAEVVFDYCFMGEENEETVAIQVARDRRTKMTFAHVVPKKGMTHEHGAVAMLADLKKLGYHEVILKCDGEPALRSVQEEVKLRREQPTILENSPVADSRSNGAAERAVQAVQEHVRVLKHGLEQRLGIKIKASHPVLSWIVEHAADLLSKYQAGDDGRTPYERLKGKRFSGTEVEFGEKIHHKYRKAVMNHKLEPRWGEGFYLGKLWRTGEAIVGTEAGVVKAGTIKRVGAHRRWDAAGLERVQGLPWKWNPDAEELPRELRLRWLSDGERGDEQAGGSGDRMVYRMRLKRQDFLTHGFTEGCPGCRALLSGAPARNHHDACRARMENAISSEPEGQERRERQTTKENEFFARVLEQRFGPEARDRRQEESQQKKPRMESSGDKRSGQGGVEPDERDDKRARRDGREEVSDEVPDASPEAPDEGAELGHDMEVSAMERLMQEDMTWKAHASDMSEKDHPDIQQFVTDVEYFDENTWEPLDPGLVDVGEKDELDRFRKMGVYSYVDRDKALADEGGKFVKTKWVRVNKGTSSAPKVRCRLVAQELGYGERIDELFAGTPPLPLVRIVLHHAATAGSSRILMFLDVKCAFLYGIMPRRVYIELPRQDPEYGGMKVGMLQKAMYGTRDAPQIWGNEVKGTMLELGLQASVLQPSLYYHVDRQLLVIVHVDDFMCSGRESDLQWLYEGLKQKYDLTQSLAGPGHDKEAKYLNRQVGWTDVGIGIEGDPKHYALISKEWGMEQCSPADTPVSKDSWSKIGNGEKLEPTAASHVRRTIARINYLSQDRPDLAVAARIASQHMSEPYEGTVQFIKRVIRYLKGKPRLANKVPFHDGDTKLSAWVDSDWAGDQESRRSTSGGFIQVGGCTVSHWSKTQSNIALSSGEAELNAAVKCMSELVGLWEVIHEITQESVAVTIHVDSSACKGMVLRHGAGRVKHLTTKQLWVQGAVRAYQVKVVKVKRDLNHADVLTHPVARNVMTHACSQMGFHVVGADR